MKLQNRWTKEFGRLNCIRENEKSWFEVETKGNIYKYNSLAKLNEDWQDYEEPEVIYYLSWDGVVLHSADKTGWQDAKQIGNFFETEEEAEKAIEKLKAWKRLSEEKYLFSKFISLIYSLNGNSREFDEYMDDILLLFGDE